MGAQTLQMYSYIAGMYQQVDQNQSFLQTIESSNKPIELISMSDRVYSIQNQMQNGCEIWYTYIWTALLVAM